MPWHKFSMGIERSKQWAPGFRNCINYQRRSLSYIHVVYITDTRFDNSWYHVKTEFNNCFVITFLSNLRKKTFLSELANVWEHFTNEGVGKLDRLWTRHDNQLSAANIELSCQLHTPLCIDCMLPTDQSFHTRSNVYNDDYHDDDDNSYVMLIGFLLMNYW